MTEFVFKDIGGHAVGEKQQSRDKEECGYREIRHEFLYEIEHEIRDGILRGVVVTSFNRDRVLVEGMHRTYGHRQWETHQ